MEAADQFSLSNIGTTTFVRQLDNKTQASSIDVVYALSSILESPKNLSRKDHSQFQATTEEMKRQAEQSTAHSRVASAIQEKEQSLEHANECKYANFWVAYDALEKHNKHLIDLGIELAKELQIAMVQIGTSIIEKKEVKIGEDFRYVMLDNDHLKDVQLFQYPLALQKLALFIMETHKGKFQKSRDLPMVVLVKNSKKGTSLIVAVMGFTRESNYVKK